MNVNKVSIVTLTYKNSHLLYKAMNSVANQNFNESYQVEYLIVDDCSDNFDKDFVENALRKTNLNYRIIVNAYNMGTVASFNNAIKISTGEIIIPLSADDEFYDNYVVNDIVNEFNIKKYKVITGYRLLKSADGRCERFPKAKVVNLFNNNRALLKYISLRGNIISGASTYYARSIFDDFGFFDEKYRLLEDYPFYLKILSNGGEIALFKRNVILYGDNGVSSSKKISHALQHDYDILYSSILRDTDFSFFERRYFLFFRLFQTKQKYLMCMLYPEQFTYFFIIKSVQFFSNLFRAMAGRVKRYE